MRPAAEAWRKVPARERGAIVAHLATILEEHAGELTLLDAIDGGHPVTGMQLDVSIAASTLRLFGGLAIELKGETIPASAGHLHMTIRESFGLAGRIIPFNHPLMFAAGKIAAPLVAGNAVIPKPPELAPLSALRIGFIGSDATGWSIQRDAAETGVKDVTLELPTGRRGGGNEVGPGVGAGGGA